jgi:hypothetical protein
MTLLELCHYTRGNKLLRILRTWYRDQIRKHMDRETKMGWKDRRGREGGKMQRVENRTIIVRTT